MGIIRRHSQPSPATQVLPALDAPHIDPKTEFFLTASHQLKSPVAIMQWCLQSVLEMKNLDPEARSLVQKALQQADGMGHLIRDMLQVFRLMAHGMEPVREAVNINKILDEIMGQYELVAHNRGVHLVHGAIETLPIFHGKDTLLRQVVINLVDNAIKYTKKGGHVTVTAGVHQGKIEINVEDEGIGIPETEQARLFTEFFRGEEAKEVSYEGTGLGLVLVKHVVEAVGGEVTFKSQFHKGTTFTVRFPIEKS